MSDHAQASRRAFLKMGAGAIALTGASGCASVSSRVSAPSLASSASLPLPREEKRIVRVLDRAGFGPRPGDVQRVASQGLDAYIEEQLRGDLPDDLAQKVRLRGLETLRENPMELLDWSFAQMREEISRATLLRAIYSPNQLFERMTDFWSNHFNVYAGKNWCAYYAVASDKSVIRAHALGKFSDLLFASAKSAAMLDYLDNASNTKGVPNENYARELLELHTLGVDGGYTQRDVQEVARCFSGWTIETRFLHRHGTFRFDESQHDNGAKVVLGHTIPAGGGQSDGEQVLNIVAAHPATARHLARKLVRTFWGEADPKWVRQIETIFLQTGGDIRAMLRPLLLAPELADAPPIAKRPLDFLVSALRATNANCDGGPNVQNHLDRMGQPLWGWPMPDGFPEGARAWSGSLLARWNFAFALCTNTLRGTSVDIAALSIARKEAPHDALCETLLNVPAAHSPLRSVPREAPQIAALLLASPAFGWR